MQVLKICLSSKSWSTRGLQVKCTQSKLSKCTAISFHSILKTTPVHKLSKSWSIEVLQVKCTPSKLSKCTPRKLSNWTGVEINSEYVPVTKELGKLFLFHSEYVPVTKELGKLFLFHYEYMFLTQKSWQLGAQLTWWCMLNLRTIISWYTHQFKLHMIQYAATPNISLQINSNSTSMEYNFYSKLTVGPC